MSGKWLMALVVLALAAIVLLPGCSGSGVGLGSPPLSGIGEITSSDPENGDGSFREVVHFTASGSGTVEIQMLQGGPDWLLDPYILVFEGDYGENEIPPPGALVTSDDDSGPDLNALVDFFAPDGQVYTVWFTTSGPADFGTYTYTIFRAGTIGPAQHEPIEAGKTPVAPNSKLKQD